MKHTSKGSYESGWWIVRFVAFLLSRSSTLSESQTRRSRTRHRAVFLTILTFLKPRRREKRKGVVKITSTHDILKDTRTLRINRSATSTRSGEGRSLSSYISVSETPQIIDIVTFIDKLPLSAKRRAIDVSKTRQSDANIAPHTPSWIERGIASHVSRRRFPFNSNLSGWKKNSFKVRRHINIILCWRHYFSILLIYL